MDIITHAVVGAAAGSVFGHPVIGVIGGVLSDLSIIGARKPKPTSNYNVGHSLVFMAITLFWCFVFSYTPAMIGAMMLGLFSHLFLDLFTHGPEWAPPLLYPFNNHRFSYGEEWEWFNASWWQGLAISISFALLCLSLSTLNLR